jgi:hypothetical protein
MSSNDSQTIIRRLIGTWRLQSFHIKTADGQVTYPFGRDAVGYYIFADSGYMSVAIMGAQRPKFAAGDILAGSIEEKVAAAEAYVSYSGQYEIQADKLIVHPEVSFFPNWVGVDQVRLFELTDKSLTLSTASLLLRGVQQTAHLVWERI